MSSNFTVKEITSILEELVSAKSQLLDKLKDLKVAVSEERDPDVVTAIKSLYGNDYIKDGKATITFEIVAQCVDIVRRAGRAKASELIK